MVFRFLLENYADLLKCQLECIIWYIFFDLLSKENKLITIYLKANVSGIYQSFLPHKGFSSSSVWNWNKTNSYVAIVAAT